VLIYTENLGQGLWCLARAAEVWACSQQGSVGVPACTGQAQPALPAEMSIQAALV
jgi:hypothetical protein